jgi:hypothetical protein
MILVAQGQPLPASAAGLPVVRSPSQRGVLLFRTLINDEARFDEIDRVRRTAQCNTIRMEPTGTEVR